MTTARVPVRITASVGTTSRDTAGPATLQPGSMPGVSRPAVVHLEARLQRAAARVDLGQDLGQRAREGLCRIGLQRCRHLLAWLRCATCAGHFDDRPDLSKPEI